MVKERFQVFARLKPTGDVPRFPYEIRPAARPRKDGSSRMVLRVPALQAPSRANSNNSGGTDVLDFGFHHVFDHVSKIGSVDATSDAQEEVFDKVGRSIVMSALDGYNATVLCYGQTASGKTYTQMGGDDYSVRGIIQRSMELVFEEVARRTTESSAAAASEEGGDKINPEFEVHICCIEVYNETAYDMLAHIRDGDNGLENWPKVQAKQDCNGVMHLSNMTVCNCESVEHAYDCLWISSTNRRISSTPMNDKSSRGHCIFTIQIKQTLQSDTGETKVRFSKLHFVDLAGSERVHKTGYLMEKQTLKEARHINTSLHFLHHVIRELHQQTRKKETNRYIPYRSSMLTSILRDSLGGNSKTVFIATLSTEDIHLEETISTLRFSQSCGRIENDVEVNEKLAAVRAEVAKVKMQDLHDQVAVQGHIIQSLMEEKDEMKNEIAHLRSSPPPAPAVPYVFQTKLADGGKPPLPPSPTQSSSSPQRAQIRLDIPLNPAASPPSPSALSTASRPHANGYVLPVLPPPPHLEGRRWSARELLTAMERSNCRAPSYPDEVVNGSAPYSPWTSASVTRDHAESSPKRDLIVRHATPPPRPHRQQQRQPPLEDVCEGDEVDVDVSSMDCSDLEEELGLDPSPWQGKRWIGGSPSLRGSGHASLNLSVDAANSTARPLPPDISNVTTTINDVTDVAAAAATSVHAGATDESEFDPLLPHSRPRTPSGPKPNIRPPLVRSRQHSRSNTSLTSDLSTKSLSNEGMMNKAGLNSNPSAASSISLSSIFAPIPSAEPSINNANDESSGIIGSSKYVAHRKQRDRDISCESNEEQVDQTIIGEFVANVANDQSLSLDLDLPGLDGSGSAAESTIPTLRISARDLLLGTQQRNISNETASSERPHQEHEQADVDTTSTAAKAARSLPHEETTQDSSSPPASIPNHRNDGDVLVLGDSLPSRGDAWGSQEREIVNLNPPQKKLDTRRSFARDFLEDGTDTSSDPQDTPVTAFSMPVGDKLRGGRVTEGSR